MTDTYEISEQDYMDARIDDALERQMDRIFMNHVATTRQMHTDECLENEIAECTCPRRIESQGEEVIL